MNRRKLTGICALLACSLTTVSVAEDIYQSVDAEGNIEFSDRPTPDADLIKVEPNVIQTNPVSRRSATTQAPPATEPADVDTDVEERNADDVYDDPDPGRATRNAVREAEAPGPLAESRGRVR